MAQLVKVLVLSLQQLGVHSLARELSHAEAQNKKKKKRKGRVPFVTQWLTNPARIHEDVGWIPGLTPWIKDPTLPLSVV